MKRGTHDALPDPRNEKVLIYINGDLVPRAEAKVSVFDSGFLVGDGVWESMRLMAMTQKQAHASPEVMTIPEVLQIATRGSAQVIRLGDQLGAIEPGGGPAL